MCAVVSAVGGSESGGFHHRAAGRGVSRFLRCSALTEFTPVGRLQHVTGRGLVLGAILMAISGCSGRFYWSKPEATLADFERDSTNCANEASFSPQAARYGIIVSEKVYRACLRARGWAREQQREPPPEGWYRGIE
jgi:hypothetical protein